MASTRRMHLPNGMTSVISYAGEAQRTLLNPLRPDGTEIQFSDPKDLKPP